MPDESDRIRQSVIKTMTKVLLILSIFHRETSVEDLQRCHPVIAVVYNHVSKYEDYKLTLDRIETYKNLLIEDQVELYCEKISDDTIVGEESWKSLKTKAMGNKNLDQENWF